MCVIQMQKIQIIKTQQRDERYNVSELCIFVSFTHSQHAYQFKNSNRLLYPLTPTTLDAMNLCIKERDRLTKLHATLKIYIREKRNDIQTITSSIEKYVFFSEFFSM